MKRLINKTIRGREGTQRDGKRTFQLNCSAHNSIKCFIHVLQHRRSDHFLSKAPQPACTTPWISFMWVVDLMRWMSIDYCPCYPRTYVPLFSSVDECGFRLFLLSDEQFQRYVWNCGGGRIWLSFFRFQLLVKTHLVLALVNCQIESVQGNWSHISCLIAQLDLLPSQSRNGIAPRSNVDKVPGPFVVVCSSFVKCATNT